TSRVEIEVSTLTGRAQFSREERGFVERGITQRRDEILGAIVGRERSGVRNRKDQAFESHAETKTFRRRTIELFRKAVIAAAADHRILRSEASRRNFEG